MSECKVCGRPLGDEWAHECGPGTEDDHYRLGYERLRASLSTAEKALRERDIAIRWALGEEALPDGRWFDCARFGHEPYGAKRVPSYWWRSILRLYSGIAADAPQAPKASEIAPDSSALEKALGALRAARDVIDRDRTGLAAALNTVQKIVRGYGWIPMDEWGCYSWEERTEANLRAEVGAAFTSILATAEKALNESGTLATAACRDIDAALSGGAHVDALKAPKDLKPDPHVEPTP